MIYKPTTPKIYTPQDDSCVLSLDARDVAGSKIYDRSGKGNHGTIAGAVLKPSNYGLPVLCFDGVDDYINLGNDSSLNPSLMSAFSIIKIDEPVNVWGVFLSRWVSPFPYHLSVGDGVNSKLMRIEIRTSVGNIVVVSNKELVVGRIYLVGFTYNGQKLSLFINNELVGSSSHTGNIVSVVTDTFYGSKDSSGSFTFKGKLNNLFIFNRGLDICEESEFFDNIRHQYGI